MSALHSILFALLAGWISIGGLELWSQRGAVVLRPDSLPEDLRASAKLHGVADVLALPRVSIIVPARNEEEILPVALASLMNLNYPDYEVILVDDASTDGTGALADDWAARDSRLRVIHNSALPTGWTGKVHALHLGAAAASGEWILATDADMVFHPAILRLAISTAQRQNVHMLSILPQVDAATFWDKTVLPAFAMILGTAFPLRLVNNPRSKRAFAAGGFILMVRRELEELGGYERLRGTVVEDLRTAEMFKRGGRRTFVTLSDGLLETRMYQDGLELWEGLSRSAFEGSGRSVIKVLGALATGAFMVLLPWACLLAGLVAAHVPASHRADHATLLLSAATLAVSSLVYMPLVRYCRVPLWYVLTLPVAYAFYAAAAVYSAAISLAGPGVIWKGRHYRSAT